MYLASKDGTIGQRIEPNHVGNIDTRANWDEDFFSVTLSGFTNPGIVKYYKFPSPDSQEATGELYRETRLAGLSSDEFTAEQVWYSSKDGTKVPMFIVKHKDTPTNGTAPAIQYGMADHGSFSNDIQLIHILGYGGFSYSIMPFCSPHILTFIKAYRGILAVPNIRGGGEFGEPWHEAGIREKRANVFDDFIAAT